VELTQQSQAVWPDFFAQALPASDGELEAVFQSLGRACVLHLVSVPEPFGLPPQDRLVARRWLSRQAFARQFHRDTMIVLTLVALGLAFAIAFLSIYPALAGAAGAGDASRRAEPPAMRTLN
jgi:hypothetical protein